MSKWLQLELRWCYLIQKSIIEKRIIIYTMFEAEEEEEVEVEVEQGE